MHILILADFRSLCYRTYNKEDAYSVIEMDDQLNIVQAITGWKFLNKIWTDRNQIVSDKENYDKHMHILNNSFRLNKETNIVLQYLFENLVKSCLDPDNCELSGGGNSI